MVKPKTPTPETSAPPSEHQIQHAIDDGILIPVEASRNLSIEDLRKFAIPGANVIGTLLWHVGAIHQRTTGILIARDGPMPVYSTSAVPFLRRDLRWSGGLFATLDAHLANASSAERHDAVLDEFRLEKIDGEQDRIGNTPVGVLSWDTVTKFPVGSILHCAGPNLTTHGTVIRASSGDLFWPNHGGRGDPLEHARSSIAEPRTFEVYRLDAWLSFYRGLLGHEPRLTRLTSSEQDGFHRPPFADEVASACVVVQPPDPSEVLGQLAADPSLRLVVDIRPRIGVYDDGKPIKTVVITKRNAANTVLELFSSASSSRPVAMVEVVEGYAGRKALMHLGAPLSIEGRVLSLVKMPPTKPWADVEAEVLRRHGPIVRAAEIAVLSSRHRAAEVAATPPPSPRNVTRARRTDSLVSIEALFDALASSSPGWSRDIGGKVRLIVGCGILDVDAHEGGVRFKLNPLRGTDEGPLRQALAGVLDANGIGEWSLDGGDPALFVGRLARVLSPFLPEGFRRRDALKVFSEGEIFALYRRAPGAPENLALGARAGESFFEVWERLGDHFVAWSPAGSEEPRRTLLLELSESGAVLSSAIRWKHSKPMRGARRVELAGIQPRYIVWSRTTSERWSVMDRLRDVLLDGSVRSKEEAQRKADRLNEAERLATKR